MNDPNSVTITDLFCGAGGSSTGAEQIPGVTVRMAANHWRLAIDTHQANHPDTAHDCADISQVDPARYPRTDILWASPSCTNHSVAKGIARQKRAENMRADLFGDHGDKLPDDAAVRSRATMWDVVRFAEHHQYRAIITENVVDAAKWILFDDWRSALEHLGYNVHVVFLNSAHAQRFGLPAPQSRDRMYVVAWRKGERRPEFERITRPEAVCSEHGLVHGRQSWKRTDRAAWGRYGVQYVYTCDQPHCGRVVEPLTLGAYTAIDWDLPAERIGDRAKPLSEKTLARIREGLKRYGPTALVTDAVHGASITRPVSEPLATQTTSYTRGLLIPTEGRDGKRARSDLETLRTQTTRNETGLLMPYYGASKSATPTSEPMGTLTTVDRFALVTLRQHMGARPVTEPIPTISAGGNHHALMSTDTIDVDDCGFRMLEPKEVTRGMAFPTDYTMLGTKREQVKLAGNAVTPPAGRDLIGTVVEAITGEPVAA